MMMPANFSAISENEMTYVNGGAVALEDILAPRLTLENWQKFNTNMVTLIGNAFMGNYIDNTLGKLFSGNYFIGQMTGEWGYKVAEIFAHNYDNDGAWYHKVGTGANAALNVGLNIVGNAAAIYNLATGTVRNGAEGAKISVSVS